VKESKKDPQNRRNANFDRLRKEDGGEKRKKKKKENPANNVPGVARGRLNLQDDDWKEGKNDTKLQKRGWKSDGVTTARTPNL